MPPNASYDGSLIALLEQLRLTADLEGLAVIDLGEEAAEAPVAYSLGVAGAETTALGQSLLVARPDGPAHIIGKDKRPILACPWIMQPGRPGGLLLWRAPRARPWTDNDHDLAASVAMLVRTAIGTGMGQVGIDRLTGIPNRRWFLEEADRHIDRLDRDDRIGTVLLIDVDDLRGVNVALGRAGGDGVLLRLAAQLQTIVRPGDIIARVGADEFAVWQDGMDHLTAAERADALCAGRLFQDMPNARGITVSIGIASRRPHTTEDIRTLLRRAHMAAREVKAKGGGGWRVAHGDPLSRSSTR